MSGAPAFEAARLRRVFELERDRGYTNQVVLGGLDRMLIQMREDGLLSATPLDAQARLLPPGGYRSLDGPARQAWVERAIRALASPPQAASRAAPRKAARTPSRRAVPAAPAPREAAPLAAAAARARLTPDSAVVDLPGVGKAAATRFARLGVETARDAVFLFPRRFNDFSDARRVRDLEPGPAMQSVTGTLLSVGETRFGRRMRGSQAVLTDGTGVVKAVWWNMPYVARALSEGQRVVLSGRVREYRGRLQMENPEYEAVDDDLAAAGRLQPVYPATSGLSQGTIRAAVRAAVEALAGDVEDPVPAWVCREEGLPHAGEAIRQYHYPPSAEAAERARQRLATGELLAVQCAVLMRRAEWQSGNDAPALSLGDARGAFLESLPFPLTAAQARCLGEIESELAGPHPMLRLLQGDVGSGKTVLAFAACFAAVRSGYQAALMAPTEILAEQHYRSLARLLGAGGPSAFDGVFTPAWLGRPLRVLLLTGSHSAAQKQQVRNDAAHGGADIIIGTHALLEDGMAIPRLGLAVIDEQHRFGVLQRARLRQKGMNPHLLVMTATPIPRTLALTVYGDLEVSTIDELPPGRKPIRTRWYQPDERDDAYRFLRARLDAGEQAFVICPLVEESEALDVRSAEDEFARLSEGPLRGYRIDLLHGRMTARVKDEVMGRFARGEAQVLVSTSVVEVGIDVPAATAIVIEGAERFGLSQLHQFRGRVGRSERQSYCLLFSTEEDPGPEARERLQAMCDSTDGLALAEVDLAMRGEGETWGRLQSGSNSMLRVARLTDRELLMQARAMAARILDRDPMLQLTEHRALAAAVRPFLERATEPN